MRIIIAAGFVEEINTLFRTEGEIRFSIKTDYIYLTADLFAQ